MKVIRPLVVGIGEALLDIFPSCSLIGGAPLNAAFHAHQLLKQIGGSGCIVSRVGSDDFGQQLKQQVQTWQMNDAIQIDPIHPTGQVLIRSHKSEPDYEILPNVAWDFLAWTEELGSLAQRADAVTFGTLAQRSETTRSTIYNFLKSCPQAIRLFDVNLRKSFHSSTILNQSCQLANIVKCNHHEVSILASGCGFAPTPAVSVEEPIRWLLSKYHLKGFVLTRGSQGTVVYTSSEKVEGKPVTYDPDSLADPVGAGDACTAGILVGLGQQWPWPKIVHLANHLGAWVASRSGATPTFDRDWIRQMTNV